jgi:hypothetical protein
MLVYKYVAVDGCKQGIGRERKEQRMVRKFLVSLMLEGKEWTIVW